MGFYVLRNLQSEQPLELPPQNTPTENVYVSTIANNIKVAIGFSVSCGLWDREFRYCSTPLLFQLKRVLLKHALEKSLELYFCKPLYGSRQKSYYQYGTKGNGSEK
jgi:hypothetical protein